MTNFSYKSKTIVNSQQYIHVKQTSKTFFKSNFISSENWLVDGKYQPKHA